MLAVEGLRVRFGKLIILDDVSLYVRLGEIIGVTGMNGAGKSTFFETLMGLVPVDKGSIRLREEEISHLPTAERVRRGMALVPEGRHIFKNLTVEENLRIGGYLVGQDPALRARLKKQFPVLERYRNRCAGFLSGGELQQLAIARALMQKPQVLLLDEPTMGLSPAMTKRVYQDMETLREQGCTLLVSSQRLDKLMKAADRVFHCQGGRIRQTC